MGDEDKAPYVTTMVEENLGPYERRLLKLSRGDPPVDDYAKRVGAAEFKAMQLLAASITKRAKDKIKGTTRTRRRRSRKLRGCRRLLNKVL